MKTFGIILAAGRSSRLYPATLVTTKQLLPIYDKPLIFYPLSLLMLGGIRDIVIITNAAEEDNFKKLFRQSGLDEVLNLQFLVQKQPNGIPEAFNLVDEQLGGSYLASYYDNVVLVLGDNIFHGAGMSGLVREACRNAHSATIFGHTVGDLHRFGVAIVDDLDNVKSITEKPITIDEPKNSYAVTGLYAFPNDVFSYAATLKPSKRGETEIVDLLKIYLERKKLYMEILPRGISWFDTGTPDSLLDAAHYVKTIQSNQGLLVGSPHEVAVLNGWMGPDQLGVYVHCIDTKSDYSKKLQNLIED